jgi:hypothetical protein
MKLTCKKLFSVLLVLAMVIGLMPTLILTALANNTALIIVGGQTANAGEAVTVPVSIADNPGFASFVFTPTFDASVLTLTAVEKGSMITSTNGSLAYGSDVVFGNSMNTTGDGVVLNLHFTVSASAAAGVYPISLALKNGDEESFVNENAEAVLVTFVAGNVTVNTPTPVTAETPAFTTDLSATPVTYTVGQPAVALTATAGVSDGGTVTYHWYCNTANSTTGGTLVGTGETYVPSTATAGTMYYYAVATNTLGESNVAATSAVATVTVTNGSAPATAQTPVFTTDLCAVPVTYSASQTAAALTVAATVQDGGMVTYQWYSNTVNSTTGGEPVGTGVAYIPSTVAVGTTYYYVVASNALGESTTTATSSVATVTVTPEVIGTYSLTFQVAPPTINVSFYTTTGYDANGADLYDASAPLTAADGGAAGGYRIYAVTIPGGVTTISFRGTDAFGNALGGMTVNAGDSAGIITLRQTEAYVRTRIGGVYPTADQVRFVIRDADYHMATCGSTYLGPHPNAPDITGITFFRFLLLAGGNAELYTQNTVPQGALAQSYGTGVALNTTIAAEPSVASVTQALPPLYGYTITAPSGARVQVFDQLRNFYTVEVPETSSVDNGDGTASHVYTLSGSSGNLTYRISMSGRITKAGYLAGLSAGGDMTVGWTAEDADPGTRVNEVDSAALAGRLEESVLLNVNRRNCLELGVGGTYRLRAYRAWQIINSDTANIMIEPDFHCSVLSGGDVVSVTPVSGGSGNAANNWLDITALRPGTAILRITYDAIDIGGSTTFTGIYAASDPLRAGIVVVQVGSGGSASIDPGIGSWDAEYDTVYFTGATGSFRFFPSAAGGITCVEVLSNPSENSAWTTLTPINGAYTATIVPGNNLLRITTEGACLYQLVRGAAVTPVITNATHPGEPIRPGDRASVFLSGLYMPIPKFSGIYNPGFEAPNHQVAYTMPSGVTLVSTVGENQYDLRTNNGLTVSAAAAGTYTLTGAYIHFTLMGAADPLGMHRTLTEAGVGANFNAVSTVHDRSSLPNIELEVAGAKTNANKVVDLIGVIGTVTKDSGAAISAARTAYDALSTAEKAQVTNYSVLTAAEAEFDKLVKESGATPVFTSNLTGLTATYKVGATVTPLRVTVTAAKSGTMTYNWYVKTGDTGTFTQITGAISASYTPPATEKGTRYYKVVVTNTYEGKAYTAESGVAAVTVTKTSGRDTTHTQSYYPTSGLSFDTAGKAVAGYVTVSLTDYGVRTSSKVEFATPLGVLISPTQVPYISGDTIATVTLRLLDALDIKYSNTGAAAKGGMFYLAAIRDFLVSDGTRIDSFGEFDAGSGSGWMISWNNWFINMSTAEFEVGDSDIIKWQYTCQLGNDISCSMSSPSAKITGLAFASNDGTLSPSFSTTTKNYTYTVPSTVTSVRLEAVQANYWAQVVYTSGGKTYKPMQAIPVTNGTVITLESNYYNDYTQKAATLKDSDKVTITIKVSDAKEARLTPSVTAVGGTAAVTVTAAQLSDAADKVEDTGGNIVLAPQISGTVTTAAAELPKAALSDIASRTAASLTFTTPVGSLTLPHGTLSSVASQASGSAITLRLGTVAASALTQAQRDAVGDNAVYDISVTSGGLSITSFGGGSLTISLPYTLKAGENASDVKVWYVSSAGALTLVSGTYSAAAGMASFSTDHLSCYAVGCGQTAKASGTWENPFTDVSSADLCYDAVEFVTTQGLFTGTTATTFNPGVSMTRAMLVTVLYRLEGEPAVSETASFTDVKSGQWYTRAVSWASRNSLVAGYGGGKFGVNDSVTREQLAVILFRYSKYKDYSVVATAALSAFADHAAVSEWAAPAVKWAVTKELLKGVSATALDPSGNATRAQVAIILMRYVQNIVK